MVSLECLVHLLGARGAEVLEVGAVLRLLPRLRLQPPHHLVPRLSHRMSFSAERLSFILLILHSYVSYIPKVKGVWFRV